MTSAANLPPLPPDSVSQTISRPDAALVLAAIDSDLVWLISSKRAHLAAGRIEQADVFRGAAWDLSRRKDAYSRLAGHDTATMDDLAELTLAAMLYRASRLFNPDADTAATDVAALVAEGKRLGAVHDALPHTDRLYLPLRDVHAIEQDAKTRIADRAARHHPLSRA